MPALPLPLWLLLLLPLAAAAPPLLAALAGAQAPGYANGAGALARFAAPWGGALDTDGSLLLADTANHLIRRVTPQGVVTLVAGVGNAAFADGYALGPLGMNQGAVGLAGSGGRGWVFFLEGSFTLRAVVLSNSSVLPMVSYMQPGASARNLAFDDSAVGGALAAVSATGPLAGVRASFLLHNGSAIFRFYGNGTIRLLAGSGPGPAADGTGPLGARFNSLVTFTVDSLGVVWAVEASGALRRCAPDASGRACAATTPLTGEASGLRPAPTSGLVATQGGALLYVADSLNHRICTISTAAPAVTALAGVNGTSGMADGAFSEALFFLPSGLALDSPAAPTALFVADHNNQAIRKLVLGTGMVVTLAGGGPPFAGFWDGVGARAAFFRPAHLAFDAPSGSLVVGEAGSYAVRRVDVATGAVTTITGTSVWVNSVFAIAHGGPPASGAVAAFSSPRAIAVDPASGTYYVSDTGNARVRRISGGWVSTVAGWTAGHFTDSGARAVAMVPNWANSPGTNTLPVLRLALEPASGGLLLLTHAYCCDARLLLLHPANGSTVLLAGGYYSQAANNARAWDGVGAGAGFRAPVGLAYDGARALGYVAEGRISTDPFISHRIRAFALNGTVATLAGNGSAGFADGPCTTARFNFGGVTNVGLAIEPSTGLLLIADAANARLRALSHSGIGASCSVTTFSGSGATSTAAADAPLSGALYCSPGALAWDAFTNSLLLLDACGGGGYVRSLALTLSGGAIAGGSVTRLCGSAAPVQADGIGAAGQLAAPSALAADGRGYAYIAQGASGNVRALHLATRALTTLTGRFQVPGYADGAGAGEGEGARPPHALFSATAPYGDLVYHPTLARLAYADYGNRAVRWVEPGSGAAGTLLSSPATLQVPGGLAWEAASGSLLVADAGSGRVRRVHPGSGSVATAAGSGAPPPPPLGAPAPLVDARAPAAGFSGFNAPAGLALLRGGSGANATLVVANAGAGTLQRLSLGSGVVAYVAGSAGGAGAGARDGAGSAAVLGGLASLAPSALWPDIFYAVETAFPRVRRVNVTSGNVTTVCGWEGGASAGYADGAPSAARFSRPEGLAAVALSAADPPNAGAGEVLYVAEGASPSFRLRACYANGSVASVAGGSVAGGSDGALAAATFSQPRGLAHRRSASGSVLLYVADAGVHRVRVVDLGGGGSVSTAAGSGAQGSANGPALAATFFAPRAVCAHPSPAGALYIVDAGNAAIRVLLGGAVSTLAGGGTPDAAGVVAVFTALASCALDAGGGVLYVSEATASLSAPRGHVVRGVSTATGRVVTVAGGGVVGSGYDGGPALGVALGAPVDVALALDGSGGVLVTDAGLHWVQLLLPASARATGTSASASGSYGDYASVSTLVGNGSAGSAVGASAGTPPACAGALPWTQLSAPSSAATDACGYVYIADTGNSRVLRIAPRGGGVDVLLGNGSASSGGDGASSASSTSLASPRLLLPGGNASSASAYLIEGGSGGSSRVRSAWGVCGPGACAVTTLLGAARAATSVDAPCAASGASIAGPMGLASFSAAAPGLAGVYRGVLGGGAPAPAPAGPATPMVVLAADRYGNSLRALWPNGSMSTLWRGLQEPTAVAVDSGGSAAVVVNRVGHTVSRLPLGGAGSGAPLTAGLLGNTGVNDGLAGSARFNNPTGVTIDSGNMIYVADQTNHVLRCVSWLGMTVSTLAGGQGQQGFADGVGGNARFSTPSGLAFSAHAEMLVVADQGNNAVRAVALPTGIITTLLRSPGGLCGFADTGSAGAGSRGALCGPSGVAVDSAGTVFVADRSNHAIRSLRAPPLGGGGEWILRTLAGAGPLGGGFADGPSALARLLSPRGVSVASDGSGALLVADSDNNAIRVVTCAPGVGVVGYGGLPAAPPPPPPPPTPAQSAAAANCTLATLAGNGSQAWVDGAGGCLNRPWGMAVAPGGSSGLGTLYIADQFNRRVRSVDLDVLRSGGSGVGVLVTLAGSGALASANGVGVNASFNNPAGLALGARSANGSAVTGLLVSDFGASQIRSVALPAAAVTPYSTGQSVQATGLALGADGTLYVAIRTSHRVSFLGPSTTSYNVLAGSTTAVGGMADAVGTAALFSSPSSVALDAAGNVLVADTGNNRVRLIYASSRRTITIAGSGAAGFEDGPAAAATFRAPAGAAAPNAAGAPVYVADTGNHAIRAVSAEGYVNTLAGASGAAGAADGSGALASLNAPRGLAFTPDGSALLISDSGSTIRVLRGARAGGLLAAPAQPPPAPGSGLASPSPSPAPPPALPPPAPAPPLPPAALASGCAALVTTLAGRLSGTSGSANGDGTAAAFNRPFGLAWDAVRGVLWVADQFNHRIRTVAPLPNATVAAVVGATNSFSDGYGTVALLNNPTGLAVDPASGSRPPWVYIAEFGQDRVRRVSPSGLLSTYAGTTGGSGVCAGGSAQGSAVLPEPLGVAFSVGGAGGAGAGALYVSPRTSHAIALVSAGGTVRVLAGSPGAAGHADGAGSSARFFSPCGLASGPAGGVLVADRDNAVLRSVSLAGEVLTVCGTPGEAGLVDGRCSGSGGGGGAPLAAFSAPEGVAYDAATTALYVADTGNHAIRVVLRGWASTLAGLSGVAGYRDGAGALAQLSGPRGLALDSAAGVLYVSDSLNHVLRAVACAPLSATASQSVSAAPSPQASASPSPQATASPSPSHSTTATAQPSASTAQGSASAQPSGSGSGSSSSGRGSVSVSGSASVSASASASVSASANASATGGRGRQVIRA